jgi:hypothetical protein
MLTGGAEVILGIHGNSLSTAMLFGMSGIVAALFKDTTMPPNSPRGSLCRQDALDIARALKAWPRVDSFRSRPPGPMSNPGFHRRRLPHDAANEHPPDQSRDQDAVCSAGGMDFRT